MKTNYKHLFFDKDNTITRSRSPIDAEMAELLRSLSQTITIVSGQGIDGMKKELGDLPFAYLGQNGNHALDADGTELWNDTLRPHEEAAILEHIELLKQHAPVVPNDPADCVEHRGAQICFSLTGHHAPLAVKESCDPEKKIRLELLGRVPLQSEHVEVRIGGTTTLDYFAKGKHKGYNVSRFIDTQKWNREECLYFGDGLYPGGNDETVIGVIDTVPVKDHRETLELLSRYFG